MAPDSSWKSGEFGNAIYLDGGTNSIVDFGSQLHKDSDDFSMFVIARLDGSITSLNRPILVRNPTSNYSTFLSFHTDFSSSWAQITTVTAVAGTVTNSSPSFVDDSDWRGIATGGYWVSAGATYHRSHRQVCYYYGKPGTAGAPSGDLRTGSGNYQLGKKAAALSSSFANFQGVVLCAYVWNRPLTQSEMEWLSAEPFAMFLLRPVHRLAISTVFREPILPVEWDGDPAVFREAAFPFESLVGVSRDTELPFESSLLILRDAVLPVETGGFDPNSFGISRDINERLYAPFLHTRDITNTSISGSLVISRDITNRMNGPSLPMDRNIFDQSGAGTSLQTLFDRPIQVPMSRITI